jgi:hypothetical protein
MADTQVNQTGGGGDGGRGGLYALLAIVIVLVIVAIILFVPRANDGTRDIDADIRIETPDMPRPDPSPPGDQGTPSPGDQGATPPAPDDQTR